MDEILLIWQNYLTRGWRHCVRKGCKLAVKLLHNLVEGSFDHKTNNLTSFCRAGGAHDVIVLKICKNKIILMLDLKGPSQNIRFRNGSKYKLSKLFLKGTVS